MNQASHTVSSPKSLQNDLFVIVVWITFFMIVMTLLQMYVPYPIDDDTAYHFFVAQKIRAHGILYAFPWTPFSWLSEHYADKELFFHLLFVPLTDLEFVTAARIVGTLGAALILSTLYLILRSEKVRYPGLWALMPLGVCAFVFRIAQVRPQLLSITLALIVLWACTRNRLRVLAVVALIYPLTYVAFWQIPLIIVIGVETARMCAGERVRWKPMVTLLAGIAVGVALHPNTVNLLKINWIHMYEILLRNAWGGKIEFNLGEEFDPFSVAEWITSLAITVSMLVYAWRLAWIERRNCSAALGYVIVALLFGILTIRTNRFLEYFVPFTSLALAVTSRRLQKPYLAPTLLVISLIYTLTYGLGPYNLIKTIHMKNGYIDPETARVLQEKIPIGAQVFTANYYYTGSLLLTLPGRYLMVALDPTLLYMKDPSLYDAWYRVLLDAPEDSANIVRTRFNSRYVVCMNHPDLWPFFSVLSQTPGVTNPLSDEKWLLFDLGDPNESK